jgi:hypothetical protein
VDDIVSSSTTNKPGRACGVDDAPILILFPLPFSEWVAPAKHYWLTLE